MNVIVIEIYIILESVIYNAIADIIPPVNVFYRTYTQEHVEITNFMMLIRLESAHVPNIHITTWLHHWHPYLAPANHDRIGSIEFTNFSLTFSFLISRWNCFQTRNPPLHRSMDLKYSLHASIPSHKSVEVSRVKVDEIEIQKNLWDLKHTLQNHTVLYTVYNQQPTRII